MGSWFSQVVSGWTAGAYVLNFQAAQRAGNHQDFQVLIDGVSVGAFRPGGTAYQAYSTSTFTVSTGAHTITFQGLDSLGGDNTAFVDDVKVASAPGIPTLGDSGFESSGQGAGGFRYQPTGSAWNFGAGSGVAANYSAFTTFNPVAPEGQQVAFLQWTGAFSQVLPAWTSGAYRDRIPGGPASRQPAKLPGPGRRVGRGDDQADLVVLSGLHDGDLPRVAGDPLHHLQGAG